MPYRSMAAGLSALALVLLGSGASLAQESRGAIGGQVADSVAQASPK
jgi:hypothetical protein